MEPKKKGTEHELKITQDSTTNSQRIKARNSAASERPGKGIPLRAIGFRKRKKRVVGLLTEVTKINTSASVKDKIRQDIEPPKNAFFKK